LIFEAVTKAIPTLKFATEIHRGKVIKLKNTGVIKLLV